MTAEASLSLSTEGKIIRFGSSLEGLLGYKSTDALKMAFVDLISARDKEDALAFLSMVKLKGLVTGRKVAFRHKDGSVIDVYLSAYSLRDLTGEINSCMVLLNTGPFTETPVIFSDEFQRMFRFSNDAVAITDKDGLILDVNKAFLDTYGYAREEVLGKNPGVLKSSHSTIELYQRMWKDILDPERGYWRGEIINLAKDGTEVPVLLSINAITDSGGEIKNFLGIAFDMTGQKEMERTRDMYVNYIVHDMRGPLTSIMANTEMLSMTLGDALGEKAQKKLRAILDSSVKLSNMAKDMLDYNGASNGRLVFNAGPCDFAAIMKSAVDPFQSSGKRLLLNGAQYGEAAVEPREITADGEKVQRVIYNLLSNALKYAAETVTMSYEFTGGHLCFAVENDGRSLSAQEANRVFEPYYQTEDGIKAGGTGLGLSIVKEFVEAHGGRVWIEPGEKRGVTFYFTIPV